MESFENLDTILRDWEKNKIISDKNTSDTLGNRLVTYFLVLERKCYC